MFENYTFADFAGDEETFFSEYFNKKPLLRKNAFKGDPRDILSFQKVDDLLNLEAFRPPYIRITQGPRAVSQTDYTRNTVVQRIAVPDVIVPERVYELFRSGATVALGTLNNVIPPLRQLTRIFTEKFAAQTDISAFMTPAGRRGRAPHHDAPDVFVVQLEGTKRWTLWEPPAERTTRRRIYDTIEELGEPTMDVLLEPGDILYLPFNTPHAAEAKDQMSLHVVFTIRPRLWEDLLKATVGEVLDDTAFSGFPYLAAPGTGAPVGELKEMLSLLQDKLSALDPQAEIDRLVRTGRAGVEGSSASRALQRLAGIDGLRPDTELVRTAAAVRYDAEAGAPDGGAEPALTRVTVEDRTLSIPSVTAESLRRLGPGEVTTPAGLSPALPEAEATERAQLLARMGALELAADRDL
ncbi:cupin domain-containing protein [Streptomyces sp. NPDC060048]|uniref:cupin domain-containing protein n=1 Tax=unclassified Streptomyces TaxID=2593676 RepID=UPI0036C8D54E